MERFVLWHRTLPQAREEDERREARVDWARTVVARMREAGGRILSVMGGTVVAAFDLPDVSEALDAALGLLDEAERRSDEVGGLEVTVGGALGEIAHVAALEGDRSGVVGSVVDRAQTLANRARAGELVLDPGARDAASGLYLFGRQVGSGAAALRGQAIDRRQPRREACRRFVRHLRPAPVSPLAEQVLGAMRGMVERPAVHRVVLRGPPGAGAKTWLSALERETEPPLVLRLAGVPAALEPLGSLRRGLCRAWRAPAAVASAVAAMGVSKAASEQLMRVATGEALHRSDASAALRDLLTTVSLGGGVPWILIDPASGVDPATLDVISHALEGPNVAALLVLRLGLDAPLPEGFIRGTGVTELVLPAMRATDARAVAEVVLAEEPGSDLARRVAVLGGDTPLGVEEAARTLVASGDLVYQKERFVWRVGPRGGMRAIPTEALLDERLGSLQADAHRVLEAACLAPLGTSPAVVERVAALDGLSLEICRASIERLRLEAFVDDGPHVHPSSETLRQVVLQSMPPARHAELHRFFASALKGEPHGPFALGSVGYCLAEGGQGREGARALLEAARAALSCGFTRSAIRLAAAAVQFDPSQETRVAAAAVSRSMASRPPSARDAVPGSEVPPPSEDGEGLPDLVRGIVRALLGRDFDAAERLIDMAIAEGCDRTAADRLRSVAHLARGDTGAAMQALSRTHRGGEGDGRRAVRAGLTRALVHLHGRGPSEAVRACLGALATARELRDPRGEAAALHILASCYRGLGREEDAVGIEDASPA
jgi:hypothetical protein